MLLYALLQCHDCWICVIKSFFFWSSGHVTKACDVLRSIEEFKHKAGMVRLKWKLNCSFPELTLSLNLWSFLHYDVVSFSDGWLVKLICILFGWASVHCAVHLNCVIDSSDFSSGNDVLPRGRHWQRYWRFQTSYWTLPVWTGSCPKICRELTP